jgi:hypothetical protein
MFDVMLFICSHRSDMIFLARRPLNDHCRGFVYEVFVGPYLKSEVIMLAFMLLICSHRRDMIFSGSRPLDLGTYVSLVGC